MIPSSSFRSTVAVWNEMVSDGSLTFHEFREALGCPRGNHFYCRKHDHQNVLRIPAFLKEPNPKNLRASLEILQEKMDKNNALVKNHRCQLHTNQPIELFV
jgi:hypothetical protein